MKSLLFRSALTAATLSGPISEVKAQNGKELIEIMTGTEFNKKYPDVSKESESINRDYTGLGSVTGMQNGIEVKMKGKFVHGKMDGVFLIEALGAKYIGNIKDDKEDGVGYGNDGSGWTRMKFEEGELIESTQIPSNDPGLLSMIHFFVHDNK